MKATAEEIYAGCQSFAKQLRDSGREDLASALEWCDQPWNRTSEFWINYSQTLRRIQRKLFFTRASRERKRAKELVRQVSRLLSSANPSW